MGILRVISGKARGRKIKTLKGDTTIPTADRVKEALFSIVSGNVYGSRVLDLYAGTGSLGIEALSRGAVFCTFIDRSPRCEKLIGENLSITGFTEYSNVLRGDVLKLIPGLLKDSYDLVFLDPPYMKGLAEETLELLSKGNIISPGGIVVAEQNVKEPVRDVYGNLHLISRHKYKDTMLLRYIWKEG